MLRKERSKCNRIGEKIRHEVVYGREFLHSIEYKIEKRGVKHCQFLSGVRMGNRNEKDTGDIILSEIRKTMTQ